MKSEQNQTNRLAKGRLLCYVSKCNKNTHRRTPHHEKYFI
jgi:hypothetical protein